MENMDTNPYNREKLTEDVLKEWQNLLDETAEFLCVPAGLITRVDGHEIEILLSSKTEGNPYPAACTSCWSSRSKTLLEPAHEPDTDKTRRFR